MSATANGSLRGSVEAGVEAVVKAWNVHEAPVRAYVEENYPVRYAQKPHNEAAAEIHANQSKFKNVKEREIVQQLIEEGRFVLEGAESAGLPESLGELADFITHGGKLPEKVKVGKHGITQVGASQAGAEEVPKIAGIAGEVGKWILGAVLLAAGAVLIVYGIMVAVRPRERAFSIPVPGV